MTNLTEFKVTPEQKKEHWGAGPWVDEPDYEQFEHNGIICVIRRISWWDGRKQDYLFGGHWCGYVHLLLDHPWALKVDDYVGADVHGGITFNEVTGEYLVLGFDCAHASDLTPSVKKLELRFKREHPDVERAYPDIAWVGTYLFEKTYKDMNFARTEVKNLADQAIAALTKPNDADTSAENPQP